MKSKAATSILLLSLLVCSCSSAVPSPVLSAITQYADGRDFTVADAWTKGEPGEAHWEVVVDWQDDASPHTCTLIVREIDEGWTVTDEECQGG